MLSPIVSTAAIQNTTAEGFQILLRLPLCDDFHVHLREGLMLQAVCPAVRLGGCSRALVMPNTSTPITTCAQANDYRSQLQAVEPNVDFIMTLYLADSISADDLRQHAATSGVHGVKYYPKGVTTNSQFGVESLDQFFPLFDEMSKLNLTLHIHGEVPGVDPLHAEASFLPQLDELSVKFPTLKIVLEHVSTRGGVERVKRLSNVGGTVTAHHLDLTTDMVRDHGATSVNRPHNFCKPLAKTKDDRDAIRQAVIEGHPRFFLGSDSAPHPKRTKISGHSCAAGVFTSPYLISYVADAFRRMNCLDRLHDFACVNGAAFLGHPPKDASADPYQLLLIDNPFEVPMTFGTPILQDEEVVVAYRGGEQLSVSTIINKISAEEE